MIVVFQDIKHGPRQNLYSQPSPIIFGIHVLPNTLYKVRLWLHRRRMISEMAYIHC